MAYRVRKTEHNGAKKAKGFWGPKKEAKVRSNKSRRANDKAAAKDDASD